MKQAAKPKGANPALGRVGRYELRAELASGGMATVFLAGLQGPHGFEKAVALKRIHAHLTGDGRFVQMFLDEARLAARIHHPNVCAIVDFGDDKGTPYIVMEYLNGEPFHTVMRTLHDRGEIASSIWMSARIVHDAARGLHAAHELTGADGTPLGIVHRDVSPQNVFVLYDGLTKVVDFGVARARNRISVTRTNEVKGKLPYMSPEQFEKETVDRRSDLWALGVLLWEATVGRRLFRGESDAATLTRVLHKPIPKPSEVVTDYPTRLEEIVMKCLERDPERRYATGEALAEELEELFYTVGRSASVSQVRRQMEALFPTQIAYREALLRGETPATKLIEEKVSTLSAVLSRPSFGDDDDDDEGPTSIVHGHDDEQPTSVAYGHGDARDVDIDVDVQVARPPVRRVSWNLIVAILGVGVAVAAIALMIHYRKSHTAPPTMVIPVSAPVVATPPEPVPEVEAAPPATAEAARPSAIVEPRAIVEPVVTLGPEETDEPRPTRETRTRRTRHTAPATPTRSPTPAPEPPAPRPAPAAAPAPPAAPGTLNLIAIPSAMVRLGGREIGSTPLLNRSLPAGEHRLELRTDDGRTRTIIVRIESGQSTRQRVDF